MRTKRWIRSKLIAKAQGRRHRRGAGVFIVNLEQSSYFDLEFPSLTLNKQILAGFFFHRGTQFDCSVIHECSNHLQIFVSNQARQKKYYYHGLKRTLEKTPKPKTSKKQETFKGSYV